MLPRCAQLDGCNTALRAAQDGLGALHSRGCGEEIRPVVTIRTALGVNALCVAGLSPVIIASATTDTSDVGQCSSVAVAIRVRPISITVPVSARCVDKVSAERGGREEKGKRK